MVKRFVVSDRYEPFGTIKNTGMSTFKHVFEQAIREWDPIMNLERLLFICIFHDIRPILLLPDIGTGKSIRI